MLSSLFTSAGFAWATRAFGHIFVFLLLTADVLICSPLPMKVASKADLFSGSLDIQELNFLKHNNYIVLS